MHKLANWSKWGACIVPVLPFFSSATQTDAFDNVAHASSFSLNSTHSYLENIFISSKKKNDISMLWNYNLAERTKTDINIALKQNLPFLSQLQEFITFKYHSEEEEIF